MFQGAPPTADLYNTVALHHFLKKNLKSCIINQEKKTKKKTGSAVNVSFCITLGKSHMFTFRSTVIYSIKLFFVTSVRHLKLHCWSDGLSGKIWKRKGVIVNRHTLLLRARSRGKALVLELLQFIWWWDLHSYLPKLHNLASKHTNKLSYGNAAHYLI